jgi:colanic acid biosynthesis glycosyl transferase WcaI
MTEPAPAPSIVLLNRFYWPDVAATSQLLTDLAEDLATAGWRVTVLAGRSPYAQASERRPDVEEHRGVRIVRVWGTQLGNDNLAKRAVDYASYVVSALVTLLRSPKYDVVTAMTDPPMMALVAILATRARGGKAAYWLQDMYPQLAGRLGAVDERGPAYRLLLRLAHWMYRHCDLVIAVGPRLAREAIASGADPARVAVVHNWTDTTQVRPVEPANNTFLRAQGLEGRFVVLYSGNAGRAHTFTAVMEAARRLRDERDIEFVFIGAGNALAGLKAEVARDGLENVRFLGYLPRSDLAMSLSSASVALVTERPEVVGLLVPSKTYSILAAARPVLYLGPADSDVATIVRENACGIVIDPEDADTLVQVIRRLRDDPAEAAAMGGRGRSAAVTEFDRHHGTGLWERAVARLVGRV